MRGVPVDKITPQHPYWEKDWKSIEDVVEPILQRRQARYEQLEQSGLTLSNKHGANRDTKRCRAILNFLKEGELHPYQLVGKDYITPKLTYYHTLFRLVWLILVELPKMKLDIKPSEWVRHRLYEVEMDEGDNFDVASWLANSYHDPKLVQLRARNGFARTGRASAGSGSSSKKSASQSLKRKNPHETSQSTQSKSQAPQGSGPAAARSTHQHGRKRIKVTASNETSGSQSGPPSSTQYMEAPIVHLIVPAEER
jgi:hypothetical protein